LTDYLRETLPTFALVAGVALIALGFNQSSVLLACVCGLVGATAIRFWEKTPMSLSQELFRVCNRLDMGRVDFIYDNDTEKVLVVVLTKDDEVHQEVVIREKE
jgi:hypothetical protein